MLEIGGKFLDRKILSKSDFTLSVQSPAGRDESREDKTTIKCETSPPSSPRSLRLEKLGHPAFGQDEGKRYISLEKEQMHSVILLAVSYTELYEVKRQIL